MTDSDFQLDDEPKAGKVKSATPAWMVAMVIIAFVFYTAMLVLQFMEYKYLRGGSASESDPYAAPVLIPTA
jgi:hypothetical protein